MFARLQGHGLSYTSFAYSDLKATATSVTCTVTNTGTVAGEEVAQLYLGYPEAAGEPPKVLRGISKTMIAPGAKTTITFPLDDASTSVWDVGSHAWKKVSGSFGVMVGSSSRDIRLTSKMQMSA